MVNEILRILDKTIIFTIIFILVNLIKIVCSCVVLYYLEEQYYGCESWLVLILFVSQNVVEAAYLMIKLIQTLGKQRIVLGMYCTGKEINFNPYETNPRDKILELFYYAIMMLKLFFFFIDVTF